MKSHIRSSLSLFTSNCERADGLRLIYEYLTAISPKSLNCDDVLRSALLLCVSSFDLFMHDIFRTEVVYRISARRKVDGFKIPFDALFIESSLHPVLVDEQIRRENSYKSFVAPDKIAECLRPLLAGSWDKIALEMCLPPTDCKARLKSIIDLRNRIAHEADVNPSYAGIELWPIYSVDVESSIDFLRSLGEAIAKVVDDT